MTQETTTGAAGQGTAAGATQGGTPQPGTDATRTDEPFDKDRALNTIRQQRESETEAKRQLQEAIARAEAAERERDELKSATQTEAEKAVAEAEKRGFTAAETEYQAHIRHSEVRRALTEAGCLKDELDLAARAPEFEKLEVKARDVKGVAEAVERFKASHPALFAAKRPAGSPDGGRRDTDATVEVAPGIGRLRKAYSDRK